MDTEIDTINIRRIQTSLSSQLKKSLNISEDLTSKGTKLSGILKTTISALCDFCESYQKLADLACMSEGGSKEIATVMTRINLKQKNIETSLRFLSNQIISCMVNPLTTKIEDWRRFPGSSEKEYQRSLKEAKSKLKGLMGDSQKLTKKSKKNSQSSKLNQLQSMNNRISFQGSVIRDIEIQMLKSLMLEERARYCFLANCFNPIFELQLKMFNEVAQLEDLVFQLQQLSREPDKLVGEAQKQLVAFVGNNDSSFDNNPPCFTSLNGSIVDGQSLSSHSSSELNPGRKTLVPSQEFTATDSGINLCPNNKSNGIFEDGLSYVGASLDKTSILSANSSLSNTSSSGRPSQVAYKSVSEYMAMVYPSKRSVSEIDSPTCAVDPPQVDCGTKSKQDFTLGRSRVEPEESESEEESEEESSSSSEDEMAAIPHSPSYQAGLKSVSRPQSPVAATLDRRATVSGSRATSLALRMVKSQTLGPNHRKNRPNIFIDSSARTKMDDEADRRSESGRSKERMRHPSRGSDVVLYPEQAIPLPSHYSNLEKLQNDARRKYSMVLSTGAETMEGAEGRRTTTPDLAITEKELRVLQQRQQAKALIGGCGKLPSESSHYADRKIALLKQKQSNGAGEQPTFCDPYSLAIDSLDSLNFGSNAGSTATIASNSTGESRSNKISSLNKGLLEDDEVFELPPPPPE